jgi:hypothetical protein
MGFITITQTMQLANKTKVAEPQVIIVVVAINLPKNEKWLPGVYEKTNFWGQGRSVLERGSMIGWLKKSLLDKTESRTLREGENIPIVIVDDHYTLKWFTGDKYRRAPATGSSPQTPAKTRDMIRDRILKKKALQSLSSPPDQSTSNPRLSPPSSQIIDEFASSTTLLGTLTLSTEKEIANSCITDSMNTSPSLKRRRPDGDRELQVQKLRTGHSIKGEGLALTEEDEDDDDL